MSTRRRFLFLHPSLTSNFVHHLFSQRAANKAGIDTNKYVTHSCRAAASSFAQKRRVPLKKIIDSCGWALEATFRRHYQKKITGGDTIGEHLLL